MRRCQQLFCQTAHNNARKSCMNHKHGCVIVYNDKEIVAQGFNHDNCTMNDIYSVHAEVNAINQLRKNIRSKDKKFIQKCSLYVVRVGSPLMNYPLKNSEPCEHCTKSILKMGIPKVYYSTNDEFLSALEIHKNKKESYSQGRPIPITPPQSHPQEISSSISTYPKKIQGRPITPLYSYSQEVSITKSPIKNYSKKIIPPTSDKNSVCIIS